METMAVDGNGLVLPGWFDSRAEALVVAREWLEGADQWEVETALLDRPGLLQRAWWGGADLGFVGEEHPQATPVTVVALPSPLLVHKGG